MKGLFTLISLGDDKGEAWFEYKGQPVYLKDAHLRQFMIMMGWCQLDCINNDGELVEIEEERMEAFLGRKFEKGDIVMETKHWPNGKRMRTVGYIASIEEDDRKPEHWHVILNPLPRSMADPIREKYCERHGYNYHTFGNTYSDQFGFASHYISMDDTVVLGRVEIRGAGAWTTAYPKPGDRGYDLMC